jgi:hypothetical protein
MMLAVHADATEASASPVGQAAWWMLGALAVLIRDLRVLLRHYIPRRSSSAVKARRCSPVSLLMS